MTTASPLSSTLQSSAFLLALAGCSCLEFLLDNGADPSLRDKQGYTAVHYAAAYGNRQNLELVSELQGPLCCRRASQGAEGQGQANALGAVVLGMPWRKGLGLREKGFVWKPLWGEQGWEG